MPTTRNVDGTWSSGLDPDKVPVYARKGAGLGRLRNRLGSMPKNPLLKITASRKIVKDDATGALSTRQPTDVSMLYKPGGLLYKPPA